MTRWAALVDTNAPLPEYPRPQMVRTNWMNLNGLWQFQAGATNDAVPTGQTLASQILVPYPMESAISGVMQYHQFSWYRCLFAVPAAWSGQRIILHLDAVNWQATVYVNGQKVGVHKGGYDAFSYDLTTYLTGGTNELIVNVYSPEDNAGEPRGKQSLYPGGIMYTSSSGIWQPAWLEPVDPSGASDLQIIPDIDNSRVRVTVSTYATAGVTVVATALTNGVAVGSITGAPQSELDVPVPHAVLWSPENPFLYDLQITVLHNGVTNDSVMSYFGMRKISVTTVAGVPQIYLNNQPYFEMGPLDQGFWPDGIYTAPTDAAQEYDLQMEKTLGFNMVRKHIKTERQRWYYWADKLGLLVWQDMPSGNSYTGNPSPPPVDPNQFITELTQLVQTHWNHPCVIMWDVFNESQGQQNTSGGVGQTNTAFLVQLVKTMDPSRLVNQASGGDYYGVGDVFDQHSYPPPGDPITTAQVPVDGEYGGIGFLIPGHLWNPSQAGGAYTGANTTNDIATIYDGWSGQIAYDKSSSGLNAAVYTQITDVENECNGLMTYDRWLKINPTLINASNKKAINGRTYLSTILPNSQNQPHIWNYTTNTPAANWYTTNFDDSSWKSGPAGFGTSFTPGAVVRTTWNSSDIWLRQKFTMGPLSAADRANLTFNLYHDEDCQIYINGVLAGSVSGYSPTYILLPMTTAGQNALIPNATNVIAVHCINTTGGQDIDVGIARENLVLNAFVTPTDYQDYWPLDETNGTTAHDVTAMADNGTVNGATWSSSGQVAGCLNFNGVNNYVQVANTVTNDFSLSFWVKTTQSGGAGQWWQGRCLVDGFVASNTNDFGTSLSGNNFAFGTGNPDTTIVSTAVINDGAWHQCVATRVQSTGAMQIYVDGVWQASGIGGTNALTTAAALRFGCRQTGINFFNGSLDDIRIYGRALGSNEVAALYVDSAAAAAAPTNVVATAGYNQTILNWASVPAIAGYDVKRSLQSGGPYTTIATVFSTTYTDLAVANGGTYYYVVAAINTLGDGANSTEVSATPSLMGSLKTWLTGTAISGVANGAALANWPDLSGNGDNAAQTNGLAQPVYLANGVNGLPAVSFNAAGSNYLSFARPVQDDFTLFCVFQSTQGLSSGSLYFQGAGLVSGEVSGVTGDFGTCLFSGGQVCAGTGNPDIGVSSTGGFNNGRPHLLTFKRIESTGEVDLYVDSVFMGTTNGSTSTLQAPNQLVLGAQQTLDNFFSGKIAEVKIFSAALSDADRGAEESELECKYGISGAGIAPGVPPGLAGAANNGGVSLTWQSSAGAAAYTVARSATSGGAYTLIASNLAANSFVDTNATSGKTNYYEVAAMNNCAVSASTVPVGVYLPNPLLSAVSVNANAVNISWPLWATKWGLYYATNLVSPINWAMVTNGVGTANGQYFVSIATGPGTRFFRLMSF